MLSETVTPNDAPICDMTKIPLHTFLPSVEDCIHIQEEFEILSAIGVLTKSEQAGDDMIDIMAHIHFH